MKKVILNKCCGGFNVSKEAYELYANKKGLKLYLYKSDYINGKWIYKKVTANDSDSISNTYFIKDMGNNVEISDEDYEKYSLYLDDGYREDSTLIEVIEELEEKASGIYGDLKIVEIPDNLDYVIDDYYGIETLHEKVKEW